ncbi:MAG: SRPBCC family protein [Chitinophaga sp.]|uniref:SRPBCC family protein n=1 Tax=Chitinophaga sp. TaxID=1869181 RepID=UPI0025BB6E25|nr:SRPBCC family protein [Chitinophaga sp.]MBV8251059.1 SRPBCC family protein [Chitinophaga sp.]
MSNKVTVNATIHADAKKVWEYYTAPEHITQWNFADPSWHCPSVSNDMRIGGKYVARMEAKDGSFGFDFEATYDAINPGKSFTYTIADGRQAVVDFNGNGNQTDVVVSFDPEDQNPVEMQKGGWQAILNSFKQYAENN